MNASVSDSFQTNISSNEILTDGMERRKAIEEALNEQFSAWISREQRRKISYSYFRSSTDLFADFFLLNG
jgi:hypothetical protein